MTSYTLYLSYYQGFKDISKVWWSENYSKFIKIFEKNSKNDEYKQKYNVKVIF